MRKYEGVEIGSRLRARREQVEMTTEVIAGIIDLNADGLEEIVSGRRGLLQSENDGLMSILCVGAEYLDGRQAIEELVSADGVEAQEMIANIVVAYWKLPNHLARKVAFVEVMDFLGGVVP